MICFGGAVGLGYFASLVKDEQPRPYEQMQKDIYNYEETSYMYFDNNVYLGKFRSDLEREEVKIKEISPLITKALISTEDEYFYTHKGVVPKAVFRAVFQEATNSAVSTGGSTLTQQLVKNQILTNETSFTRKATEILLAYRLERFFSKDEILEAYLNVSPFGRNSSGRNIAGIQTAAKGIFGVDANKVNLPQAAFLAGLPQSPSRYAPFTQNGKLKKDLSAGMNRMKYVLKRMNLKGVITDKEYTAALNYNLKKDFLPPRPSSVDQYPWITFEIERRAKEILVEMLIKKDGYDMKDLQDSKDLLQEYNNRAEKQLRQNGYKIYTTINKKIYDKMQEEVKKFPYYGQDVTATVKDPDTKKMVSVKKPLEAAAILIENQTGKIISFVGGRNYTRENLNHATQAYRSNGSTMKPLLVYAPGMELGKIQPGTVLADVDLAIRAGGQVYRPKNFDRSYHGLVSARVSLQKSYNVSTVRAYMDIMDKHPISFLRKMGITSIDDNESENVSLSLGGATHGVTIEENINAYTTFGNGGKFIDAYLIDKIVANDGTTIYQHKTTAIPVFSPQTNYLAVDVMRGVLTQGTGGTAKRKLDFSADWAGKSGTSQDQKDAWFVATNPSVTFGVWFGYDTPAKIRDYKGYTYSQRTQMFWAKLINASYTIDPKLIGPKKRFEMPGNIVHRSYCMVSGLRPSDACSAAGLVTSDIYNSKYTPKKVDTFLTSGGSSSYVLAHGEKYAPLEQTPREFVHTSGSGGIGISNDLLEFLNIKNLDDMSQLKIGKDKQFVNGSFSSVKELKENGKKPGSLILRQSNNTIQWSASTDSDVIGYRVYRASDEKSSFSLVTSIQTNASFSYTIKTGTYYVVAVDIAGRESSPSNNVKKIEEIPVVPTKPEPDDPGKEPEPEPEPDPTVPIIPEVDPTNPIPNTH